MFFFMLVVATVPVSQYNQQAVQSTSTLKHGNPAAVVSSFFDIPVDAFSQTMKNLLNVCSGRGRL